MTRQQLVTLAFFLGSFVVLFVLNATYDLVVIWKYGPEASISRTMLSLREVFPVGPCLMVGAALFVMGLLIGHFWWEN